ncbi:MAG: cytidine deaminase [Rhodothermales bacterium]|nr:cytidine deaminase [Rhodothermales bacterium]MBO6781221.1 cytidine deaminase [Rhodothermales bacterium]
MSPENTTEALLDVAREFASRAHVPYSRRAASAAVLLPDGGIVAGVRVESASFPLTIPAALNAVTTAVAMGHRELVALAVAGPVPASTTALASGFGLLPAGDRFWCWNGAVPTPRDVRSPFIVQANGDMIALAREAARRAHIPESEFPVGAVLRTRDGRLIPGCNVEHPDWTCILCAERNALGTAVTYDALPAEMLALSCPTAPDASPCGACRQLIFELIRDATITIDRGAKPAERISPSSLLPGAFSGSALSS